MTQRTYDTRPITDRPIEDLVSQVIDLELELAPKYVAQKALFDEIKLRAEKDKKGQKKTKTGGRSWQQDDGRGICVFISLPLPSRKVIEHDELGALREMCNGFFAELFERRVVYVGVEGFIAKVKKTLTKSEAAEIIELATKAPAIKAEVKVIKEGK